MAATPRKAPADESVFFDGAFVFAYTRRTAATIFIQGHPVCNQDRDRTLAIRGGKNFVIGAYRVRSVEVKSNAWTLDRDCSDGPGSGMLGIAGRRHGKWHKPVAEFYDANVPDNPGRGEAQQVVLAALNHVYPEILSTLAERCLKDEFLHLRGTAEGEWADGPGELQWGHVRNAGQFLRNLAPLRAAIKGWASDIPLRRWNLCDNDGAPLEWIANAAIQTLVYWYQKDRLPKTLKWENLDFYCYGSFNEEMFKLERAFDAGSGFLKISPTGEEPEAKKLSDRAQREAKQRYKQLGEQRKLTKIKNIAPLHFQWYVLRSFLGWTPTEIDRGEQKHGRIGGSPGDVQESHRALEQSPISSVSAAGPVRNSRPTPGVQNFLNSVSAYCCLILTVRCYLQPHQTKPYLRILIAKRSTKLKNLLRASVG